MAPRLQRLWAKYREAAFTSNRGKHMRFDPGDVATSSAASSLSAWPRGWRAAAGGGRAASPACGAR